MWSYKQKVGEFLWEGNDEENLRIIDFFFVCFFNCDLAQKPLTTPGSILDHSSGKHFGTGISLFLVELHRICPILGSTDPQQNLT